MKNKENTIKKENKYETFADLSESAKRLSNDIALFLGEEMEELNVSSYQFRTGMERYLNRVLTALLRNTQPVVIFPDSVPGFTMMVFKKVDLGTLPTEAINKAKRNPTEEINQSQAIDSVISKFFDKNKQKVLLIENTDLIFALFPMADTKRNLKEMELYITY